MQDLTSNDTNHPSALTSASASAASIPPKRPLQSDDNNPDSSAPPKTKLKEKNVHREAREKKESWKKKDAAQGTATSNQESSGGVGRGGGGSGKQTGHNTPGSLNNTLGESPGLMRWRLPPPQESDYYGHRAPPLTSSTISGLPDEFFAVNDHPMNRRGFRYAPCEASRMLSSLSYRQTEYEPYKPRINWEDMNSTVHINKAGNAITTEKGWRMARANIGIREGDWYYECKILRGINPDGSTGNGHVRIGWARREAPLDAPVGFDAHSYGLRDNSGQKVHMSRPKDFLNASFTTSDIIGLHISIPSLKAQREISTDTVVKSTDILRDRIPIRFKNQLWFEQFEYMPTKDMEDLMNPLPGTKPTAQPKILPGSFIKVYKNGRFAGTAWEDLFAFLPPASRPLAAIGGRELDDGTLGYYPAVSVFRGGAVQVNFGPTWEAPPVGLEKNVRPMCERYEEQIAEDVVYDLVDEVDLLFTGGGRVDVGEAAKAAVAGGTGGVQVKEEIKEMVMEDE